MHPLFQQASGLTESIIGAAVEVHRDKGPGLIESIYEWCLTKEFELRGLSSVSEKPVVITYKGLTRGEPLRFDLLVEGCVLGGSKSRGEDFTHPPSTTPELHEVARFAGGPAHQLPRDETDRRCSPPDPAGSQSMKIEIQQKQAAAVAPRRRKGTESSLFPPLPPVQILKTTNISKHYAN